MLHPSNIVTKYPLKDNEEIETLTINIGIATGMVIATVIVLTSLVAITVGLILRKRSQQTLQQDDNLYANSTEKRINRIHLRHSILLMTSTISFT